MRLMTQAIAGDLKPADHPSEKLEELTRDNEVEGGAKSTASQLQKESEKQGLPRYSG